LVILSELVDFLYNLDVTSEFHHFFAYKAFLSDPIGFAGGEYSAIMESTNKSGNPSLFSVDIYLLYEYDFREGCSDKVH